MCKLCVRYVFISLVYIPKNGITGSCSSSVFNILRSCKLFSKVVALFCHLIRSIFSSVQFSSFQSLSHVQLFRTPWTAAHHASLSITNSWNLLKLMSIELMMPSNHLVPFSNCIQSFPSSGCFSTNQPHIRWPKFWSSASTSVLPINIQG